MRAIDYISYCSRRREFRRSMSSHLNLLKYTKRESKIYIYIIYIYSLPQLVRFSVSQLFRETDISVPIDVVT